MRRELARLGRRPRKGLGQHFLSRPEIAGRIVDLAELNPGDRVVEIGPGLGALSDRLAAVAGMLWLVAVDADLARHLRERYAGVPRVHVVEADALEIDFEALLGPGAAAIVVANLPYNIATAVLAALLRQRRCFARFVVMVQREVAARLRARPGTREYGSLSVFTQLAARVRSGMRVSSAAFVPPPKVDSEVVILEPHATPPVAVSNPAVLDRIIRAAFGQRRKQLANSLRGIVPDAAAFLRGVRIDPTRRAETLSLAEFAALSNAVTARD